MSATTSTKELWYEMQTASVGRTNGLVRQQHMEAGGFDDAPPCSGTHGTGALPPMDYIVHWSTSWAAIANRQQDPDKEIKDGRKPPSFLPSQGPTWSTPNITE
jgi:hypothetical protein